jgi:carboxymethylenebutenolidase
MSTTLTVTGSGLKPFMGALSLPSEEGVAPALVLVQEWWGITEHVRSLVDRFAAEGLVVLAPDLYDGRVAQNAEDAAALMNALDTQLAVRKIAAAADLLRSHPRSNGRVGVTGFCMGGALAFRAACDVENLGAVVPFYGLPGDVDWARVTAPIMAHFAEHDDWAKASSARALAAQLGKLGKEMTLHVYDASHAFMNDTRPEVYNAEVAKVAWSRTVKFLKSHLS